MKYLRDILAIFFFAAIPISGFLSTAFLIYHDKNGWGWLLYAVVLISFCTRIRTDD